VKPITLLTKNSGGDGLPTNLLVNVARYSSVKKLPRTPDSDSGWERDTDHVNPGGVNAATGGLMMSPELRSKEMMVNGGHETHQPSLHSPDMRLSTKGMHARDELSSLRSRLESLRGGSGGEHRNWSRNPAGLHYRKSDGDASADDSVTNGDHHHHHHHHRNVYNHSGGRNQHRIQTLEARTSNGNGSGSTTTTTQGVGITEKVMRGASILELEKLANGGLRLHEKNSKDRNHRRQRNNQPAAPALEYLSNGDVEMVYETDDRTFSFPSEKLAMSSHPNPNPVRQVVHDIAEKAARRTRNRVHHQSPEVRHSEDQRVDTSGRAAVGSRNNNSRVDDVNRIHQRPLLHLDTRDAAAGVSDLDSFNLDHEMRVADAGQQLVRTNYRTRQQSPNHMIMTHGLQREESSMVRALSSSHKSSIRSDQSGHHSHGMMSNGSSVHPSSYHVEVRDDHVMPGISQPASARSSSHHAQDSPFKQSFRTNYPNFEARDGLPAHLSLLHAAGGEHSSSSNNRGRDVAHLRRGTQVGQTWYDAETSPSSFTGVHGQMLLSCFAHECNAHNTSPPDIVKLQFVITEPWSKSTVIFSHMNVIHAITPPDMAKLQFCPHRTTFKEYRYLSHMNVMRTRISPDIAKLQFCHYRTMGKEHCHHLSHMNVMRTITPRSDVNIAKIHFCHQRSLFCALSGLQPRSSKATCSLKLRTAGFISIRYSSIFRLHAQSHSVAAK
jgi:hypothetical protein